MLFTSLICDSISVFLPIKKKTQNKNQSLKIAIRTKHIIVPLTSRP